MQHTKYISVFIFLFSIFSKEVAAQSSPDVVYMQKITTELKHTSTASWNYVRASMQFKPEAEIDRLLNLVVLDVKAAYKNVSALGAFNGDASFRDSVLSYLNNANKLMTDEFSSLREKRNVANKSYADMVALITAEDAANTKLIKQFDFVKEEQKKFAAKNNIKLLDAKDNPSLKLLTALKVIKHYNQAYLIFFKCSKQEDAWLSALDSNSVPLLTQTSAALQKFATDGLAKLDTLTPYENDTTLIHSAREALKFFYYEAKEKAPGLNELLAAKVKFEKVKANFNAIPEDKQTEQNIQAYNKAVDDYSTKVEQYNATTGELNKKRAAVLGAFDKSISLYLARNTPSEK